MMKDVGLQLVYTPPIIEHDQSPHNYLADNAAELDLYHKTPKLLEHLDVEQRIGMPVEQTLVPCLLDVSLVIIPVD